MCVIERAQEREQADRDAAIAASSSAVIRPAVGICYNCEDAVSIGLVFCDADCRDDFERRQRAAVREGRSYV